MKSTDQDTKLYEDFSNFMAQLLVKSDLTHNNTVKIGVAISGGADSMALVLLAHQWATTQKNMHIVGLTVDHQLRAESLNEAQTVGYWLKKYAIEHHILTWHHGSIRAKLQAQARQARYDLMGRYCQEHSIQILLTAHHANDQWETFFMRLNKGSGPIGLESIRPTTQTPYGILARPLLYVQADMLKEFLITLNQPFIQDPSNKNTDFERIQWRKLREMIPEKYLTPQTINKTIGHLQEQNEFIKTLVEEFLNQHIMIEPKQSTLIYGKIGFEPWVRLEPYLQKAVLRRIIAIIFPGHYLPCDKVINRLCETLRSGKGPSTIRGYYFFQTIYNHEKVIFFVPEPHLLPRLKLSVADLEQTIMWGLEKIHVLIKAGQLIMKYENCNHMLDLPQDIKNLTINLKPLSDNFLHKALPISFRDSQLPKCVWLSQPSIWVNNELVWTPRD